MRIIFFIAVCLIVRTPVISQTKGTYTGSAMLPTPRQTDGTSTDPAILFTMRQVDAAYTDSMMLRTIRQADGNSTTDELMRIVDLCRTCCNNSSQLSVSLTKWLREDHPVYKGKSATDVDRLRGYLLSALSKFPPNEELYGYVRSELLFAGHVYNVAAAAAAARNFPERSAEIIQLVEPYLKSSFLDEWVDITTPELIYPLPHPTKARYEIIQTLTSFGERAWPSVKLLDQLASGDDFTIYGRDTLLFQRSAAAAACIRKLTPPCCQKESGDVAGDPKLKLIGKNNRKRINASNMVLMDQNAGRVRFDDLKGKPFVLTWFYTQCTNPEKCAATVGRLARLESELAGLHLTDKVGIYGMTYDPDFDSPSILKKYGEMYGIAFTRSVKFLRAEDKSDETFTAALQLRVNYGGGVVNQHGIQLFVFDKKGRLAAVSDNERWTVDDLKKCLVSLSEE